MTTDAEIEDFKVRLASLEGEMLAYQTLFHGFLPSLKVKNNSYISRLRSGVAETSKSLAGRPQARARFEAISEHLLRTLSISMPPRQ